MNARLFTIWCLLILAPGLKAQNTNMRDNLQERPEAGSTVLDDSTRQIYGPLTVKINLERDIIYRLDTSVYVDTSVLFYHREYNPMDKTDYTYQNLGTLGTPMRPLFLKPPETIGLRLGTGAFDWYFKDNDEMQYYLTKSPYSWFGTMWGGEGRGITRAAYTRNINPLWNIGGHYEGYFIDKHVQRARRGDRLANIVSYDLHTNYVHSSGKYRLFGNVRRTRHNFTEQGGIDLADNLPDDLYFEATANPYLTGSSSSHYRRTIHLYHQFNVKPLLGVFHQVDARRRSSSFTETSRETGDIFVLDKRIRPDSLDALTDLRQLDELTNRIGLTGNRSGFFYAAFLQRRDLWLNYTWVDNDIPVPTRQLEYYLGFEGGWDIRERFKLETDLLLMDQGTYRAEGRIKSVWVDAVANQSTYLPSFMDRAYYGQHHFWDNTGQLENTSVEYMAGTLKVDTDKLKIRPNARFFNARNLYYFENFTNKNDSLQVAAVKATGNAGYFSAGLHTEVTVSNLILESKVWQNSTFGNSRQALAIPDWLIHSSVSYHGFLFDRNLELHVGVQLRWQSDYFGMGYDPGIQEFYAQDDFLLYDYWLFSAFLNAKVRSGRLFVRMNNMRQLLNDTGYFAAPYHRGMQSVIDFGFNFSFYD